MSRIDDLIAKYCPSGVEYKTLGDLGTFMRGGGPQKKHLLSSGKPCIHYGQIYTRYSLYTGETLSFVSPEVFDSSRKASPGDVIIADTSENDEDLAKSVAWIGNEKVAVSNHTLIYSSALNPKYVSYFLSSHSFQKQKRRHITGVKVRSISETGMSKIKIPVPPLEVQDEIVRILDSFTKLEAELEAELETRRKQYEYYRDSLLSFENLNSRVGGGKLIPLGQIGKFTRGTGLQKKDFSDSGIGCIHYGQIYTRYGISTRETYSYVHPESFNKFRHAATGDILIATTSENDEDLGKAVAWMGQGEIAFSGDMCSYRHEINPKYVSYFMATESFSEQKRRFITGTKVRRITPGNIAKIEIPVPPLAEQERIVAILDKFDALVNDLSSGLPAEIAARRKQYEYYRDQLLTFTPAK